MCLVIALFGSSIFANIENRTISSIQLRGLDRVKEQRVNNLIQARVGELYVPEVVEGDVHTLTHLGEFKTISVAVILQEDGTVELEYNFVEQQIITRVSFSGNTLISDNELIAATPLMQGLGRDSDAIDRGKRAIVDLYKKRGNSLVEVSHKIFVYSKWKDELTGRDFGETVVLIYNIKEGNRVRINNLSFSGNYSYSDKELSAEIKTNVMVTFWRRGEHNEQMLAEDVAILKRFYINRGFPDVRVSYSDPLSPNDKEAAVVFIIDEGRHYSIGGISAEFITSDNLKPVFTQEQIRGLIAMKEGDVFRKSDVAEAVSAINNAYGVLGRINDEDPRQRAVTNARLKMYGGSSSIALDVATATPYHANPGTTVDILFTIVEGVPTRVGVVKINGNTVTNDSVIRRSIGLRPGYPFDSEEAILSEERLNKTGLFNKVTMAIQEKDPNNPGTRDLLVDVDESQTGSINFGLSAGSDSGLLGNISLRQRNFDVADFPESWSEFIQNKSFRGAGQQFHMAFQPGDEMFNYEIGLTDPRFLDTDYSLGGTAGWNMREYRRSGHYTQETLFSRVTLGRRFGDIWIGNISIAADRIKLTDINRDVPLEIYNDRGPSSVNSIGISATRSTLHPFFRPTEGSRIRMSINQFGLPSGDYTFSKAYLTYTNYFAVERDFLGLTSTLRLDARLGYIFGGESPTFERFYLGGRSMRGFEFRTISPKGTPRFSGGNPDIPIGGDYEIFLGAQYEFPLLDKISLVAFIDSGTVADDLGFDDYRASFGAGIRLHIKELGQAPLAFDFAFPIVKQESDKKRMFSFSVQLPF